jgi:hypothetical protein
MNTDIQEIHIRSKPTAPRIRLQKAIDIKGYGMLLNRKLMAFSTGLILLISGSSAFAAPGNFNVTTMSRTVTYTATGYSQVEYMWPKSGVVCRHNKTSGIRSCENLKPNVYYQIVDFHDHKKGTFRMPPVAKDAFNCEAGSRDNLKDVRYGKNQNHNYYIGWDRHRSPSWFQLQYDGPGPRKIIAEGMHGQIKARNIRPGERYRLDDLTYGGTIFINIKPNGC